MWVGVCVALPMGVGVSVWFLPGDERAHLRGPLNRVLHCGKGSSKQQQFQAPSLRSSSVASLQ